VKADEVVVEAERQIAVDEDHHVSEPCCDKCSEREPHQDEQVRQSEERADEDDPQEREQPTLWFRCLDHGHLRRMMLIGSERWVDVCRTCEPRKHAARPLKEDDLEVLDPERLASLDQDVPVSDPHDDLHPDEVCDKQEEMWDKEQCLGEQDHSQRCGPRLRYSSSTGTMKSIGYAGSVISTSIAGTH
jgi:hypothetical protein